MSEMKAQLLAELPYHRIEQPRKPNKYLEFFGSYIALPLMTIVLVLSLLILFLLVKTYFSNSYMYAIQDNLDHKNKNNFDIGTIIDSRYDQFNNKRPNQNILLNKDNNNVQISANQFNKNSKSSLLDKIISSNNNNYNQNIDKKLR